MQSSICSFFINLIHRLAYMFEESILGKAFFAVCNFFKDMAKNSLLGKYFLNATNERTRLSCSFFGKILLAVRRLIHTIAVRLDAFLHAVSEGSRVLRFLDTWYLISTRAYGVFTFSYIFIYGLSSFVTGALTKTGLIVCTLAILLSIILIVLNRSPKALFKGSAFLKWAGGIFYETKPPHQSRLFSTEDYLKTNGVFIAAVIGAVLAVISLFVSPIYVIGAFIAALGLLMILKFTALGVFITAAFAPIFPTMMLAGLSILCGISFFIKLIANKDYEIKISPIFTALLLFAFAYLLGTLSSFNLISSARIMMIHFSFMLFCFVAISVMRDEKKRKLIITGVLFVGAFVALYGILQNFIGIAGTDSWVDSEMFEDIKVRVFSTFDNPNVLGEYLVLLIPMSLAFFMRTKNKGYKLCFFGLLCAAALCLVFTWSRGAWLGTIIAIMLCLVVSDKRWLLCGLLLIAALPFLPVVLGSDSAIVGRITSIGDMADSSTAYRVSIWRAAVDIIKDFWVSGIGPGSDAFSHIYPKYALSGASFALHSHNLFLQILVELGIGGFLAFIFLIVKLCKTSIITLSKTNNNKTLENSIVICGTAGILGLLAQGLTDYIWYNYKMVLIFWVFVAIVSSASYTGAEKEGSLR